MSSKDLTQLLDMRSLDRAGVIAACDASADDVDDGYSYQSMQDLSVLRPKRLHDSRIYFDGDAVVMIALSEPSISATVIRDAMSSDVVELRSRQGKKAMIEVDAGAGLAFSRDDDEIGFLEIFPPTTIDDYRTRIWKEPPAFRK
jgi:hypothetical protein